MSLVCQQKYKYSMKPNHQDIVQMKPCLHTFNGAGPVVLLLQTYCLSLALRSLKLLGTVNRFLLNISDTLKIAEKGICFSFSTHRFCCHSNGGLGSTIYNHIRVIGGQSAQTSEK